MKFGWILILIFAQVFSKYQQNCVIPSASELPPMCVNKVDYPMFPYNFPEDGANATALFKLYVAAVSKAQPRKYDHSVESLQSWACFNAFPQCSSLGNLPPCSGVCELVCDLCNVSYSVLNCSSYPDSPPNCFDHTVISGPSCVIPDPSFCDNVYYNTSRTYHGPNLTDVDNQAMSSYNTGSAKLPTAVCKLIYKNLICESYFRMCDNSGRSLSPCADTCNKLNSYGCTSIDCTGPQYGPSGFCYSLPLPNVTSTCQSLSPGSGLNYCNMINYPLDSSLTVVDNDKLSQTSATQLIQILSTNYTLSDECKSRIRDFSCSLNFFYCNQNPNNFPFQPCKSFCEDVLSVCGIQNSTLGCSSFLDTNCFSIQQSSRLNCSSNSQCNSGEYCYFYINKTDGICLSTK